MNDLDKIKEDLKNDVYYQAFVSDDDMEDREKEIDKFIDKAIDKAIAATRERDIEVVEKTKKPTVSLQEDWRNPKYQREREYEIHKRGFNEGVEEIAQALRNL